MSKGITLDTFSVDLSDCIDMSQLTTRGFRITTRWTAQDLERVNECLGVIQNSNEFVKCVRKRRTDVLALRRYILALREGGSNGYLVVPLSLTIHERFNEEEPEGEEEEGTCVTLLDPEPIELPIWYNETCIVEQVSRAVLNAYRELGIPVEVLYPTGVEERPVNNPILTPKFDIHYDPLTVCSGAGAGEIYAGYLASLKEKYKEVFHDLFEEGEEENE